nr:substrate-binding domain-containing protein [Alteromonas macleodii]
MLVSKKYNKMKGQRYRLSTLLLVIGLLLPFGTLADSQNTQSSSSASGSYQVPAYERKPGVAGKISSVGSDTLANLMTFWSQEFKTLYPQVGFQIQASGSSTAPPALIEGTATIGPMSRELKPSEIRDFTRTHGYPPTVLKV